MIPVLEHRGMVREVSSREGMWVWTGQKPGSLESEVKTIKKMLREEWIQKHLIFSSICFIRRLQMCLKLRCLYLNVPLSKYSSPPLDSSHGFQVNPCRKKALCLLFSPQSCPALCDPKDCSTPGFPVLQYLQEFAQTCVHWVSDTIHHLILCSLSFVYCICTDCSCVSRLKMCFRRRSYHHGWWLIPATVDSLKDAELDIIIQGFKGSHLKGVKIPKQNMAWGGVMVF